MFRAAVIGQVVVDILRDPESFDSSGSEQRRRFGGKAFNLAVALARLGCSVEIVSAVGSDPAGRDARDFLKAERVGVSHLTTCTLGRQEVPTPSVRLTEGRYGERMVSLDMDDRILDAYRAACGGLDGETFDLVFFTLEFPDALLPELAAAVRGVRDKSNCLVIANPAPRRDHDPNVQILEALNTAHILTPNQFEAQSLVPKPVGGRLLDTDIPRRLNEVYNASETYVTAGLKGWRWAVNNQATREGGNALEPARVVDKVGASDVFTAVIGMGRRLGYPAPDAALAAGVAARLAVERAGGAEACPTSKELAIALKPHGLGSWGHPRRKPARGRAK